MPIVVNKIAVIANHYSDRQLLACIIKRIACTHFKHIQDFDNANEQFDAIVVLHRRSVQQPNPCIPKGYNPLRLIVLSDSIDEQNVVSTLNFGAHHYINLLESERVIAARLEAALRFHTRVERRILDVNPFIFQVMERTVYRNKRRIDLSPREFELAYYLFTNRDRVILDSELMTGVWTLPSSMDTRRIDTAICRVRNKLGLQVESSAWTLVRLRRQGYQLLSHVPENTAQDAHAL